ncbi:MULTISPECIES: hypothetical protein [unclassified Sphingomonas]|uniref:hypothetical protein n=1 Tax=Sphingomonas TaxID=13687 RepID=UPI001AD340F2|nr:MULTISPECIES: hypothetical protein [unclassified Sphingomonas]MBN8813480.1 hypothetical protein [Sphingomonas sp.]
MIRKRQSGECRRYSRKPDSDMHRREALGMGGGVSRRAGSRLCGPEFQNRSEKDFIQDLFCDSQ